MLCMLDVDTCLGFLGQCKYKVCKLCQVCLGFAGEYLLGMPMMIGLRNCLESGLTSRHRNFGISDAQATTSVIAADFR